MDTDAMNKPKIDRTDAASEPQARGGKTMRKPVELKWHINTVPAEAGEASDFVGSLPLEDDPESYIEAKESIEAGQVCRIVKGDGRGRIVTSYRYQKLGDVRQTLDDDDDDDLQLADAPVMSVASATLADVTRIAAEAGARAAMAAKPVSAPVQQPEDYEAKFEQYMARRKRERAELLEELREELKLRDASAPKQRDEREAAEIDSDSMIMNTLAKLAESDPDLRAKLVEHVFPEKADDGIVGLAREAFANPEATQQILQMALPAIQMLIGSFLPSRQPTGGDGGGGGGGGKTAQPQTNPLVQTLTIIVNDLKRNRRAGRSADAIDDLIQRAPEYSQPLQVTLAREDAKILQELSVVAGEDLTVYPHAAAWVANLRVELDGDDGDDEDDEDEDQSETVQVEASVGSSNGTHAPNMEGDTW
jgi:hypothetical protein